jgi:hypothetical protein
MNIILLSENDVILTDLQYGFAKFYPYLMIHFFDDSDSMYDNRKYLFEIAKFRKGSITISKNMTIVDVQNLFIENFGIKIHIAGYKNEEVEFIDSQETLEKINQKLKSIKAYSKYPIYNLGLRAFPDPNNNEKFIIKHLDGKDVKVDKRILKSDKLNIVLFKDDEGYINVVNASNMEILGRKKI